jgi:hypothetical protein
MKNITPLLLLLSATISSQLLGQIDSSETATHIFWTADRPLTINDFQNKNISEKQTFYCDTMGLCWGAATGLFAVLDVPKKKKDKKFKYEEAYFVAAFDKTMSYQLNDDTLQFLKQKLVFDMQELAVRKAKKELQSLYDSMPAIGTKALLFSSVKASVEKYFNDLIRLYNYEVFIKKIDGAFEKWQHTVEEELFKVNEFESTSKDNYRFVKGAPIIPNYEKAKRIIGNLYGEN